MLQKHPVTAPNPPRRRRRRLLAAAAAGVALVLATPQAASADPFFPDNNDDYPVYSSDPHLTICGRYENPYRPKLCLYASVDDGTGSDANYPMRFTKLWTIDTNKDWRRPSNWTYEGVVASEDMLGLNGRHFWAPAGYWDFTSNYLYVPDVVNGDNNTGSRIFVFKAPAAEGEYELVGQINTPTSGANAPNGGYASDPFVALDYNGTPYLFYANGTYDSTICGGISRARLASNLTSIPYPPQYYVARITFKGLQDDLGTCRGRDAYIEGPAVYNKYQLYDVAGRWPRSFAGIDNHEWIMMFSVKPSTTPKMTNPNAQDEDGEAAVTCNGSNQQALAYATAQNLTDTEWTYRGIIMCPRGAEWTNHGSLIRYRFDSVILAFHDGPANGHRRKVMLDCLTWDPDGRLRTVPVSRYNAANCSNWGPSWN